MIRAALLPLAALAQPALGQDVSDEAALLDAFVARCAEVSADPRGAVNALVGDAAAEAEGRAGAMTADGAVAQVTEPNFGTDGADGLQSVFSFYQTVVGDEARRACSLSVFGDDGALADMAAVLAIRAPELLGGPVAQVGGPVMSGGQLGQLLLWHLADAGAEGPVLSLGQDQGSVALGLSRAGPAP
jgi:hypothetical protein